MGFLALLRSIAALALLMFIPGLAWTWVFFPKREIGALERFVYSIALSIALVSIAVFFMNQVVGIRINVASSLIIIVVLTAIPLAHIYLKRRGLYKRLPFKRLRDREEN